MPGQGNTGLEWSRGGLVLLDSTLNPVYVGGDALRILLYPDSASSPSAAARLKERLAALRPPDESLRYWCGELLSGRRRYRWHWMRLDDWNQAANPPAFAMLFERRVDEALGPARLAALYKLAPREQEAAKYLLAGLDTDEIASQLGITQNSVKAVLARVMRKMGVTTRSGILGKYVGTVIGPAD